MTGENGNITDGRKEAKELFTEHHIILSIPYDKQLRNYSTINTTTINLIKTTLPHKQLRTCPSE